MGQGGGSEHRGGRVHSVPGRLRTPEELPKRLSGRALFADAIRSAVRGLVPVGGRARRMICREIVFQPFEFGRKPGACVQTAAGLRLALYIERDNVPGAQIIGIPTISDADE